MAGSDAPHSALRSRRSSLSQHLAAKRCRLLRRRCRCQHLKRAVCLPATCDPVEQALVEAEAAPAAEQEAPVEELTMDHLIELVEQLAYHTHPQEGREICPDFLLGRCSMGTGCPQHHTELPYHWQLCRADTKHWHSLGQEVQENLERLYSDPSWGAVRTLYQGTTFSINLASMQVSGSSHFSSIRRLGTSAAPNVPFHTLYRYYWKDHSGWHPYEEPFLQSIQEAVEGGHTEVTCTTTLYQYQLNLHSGYQRNMDTGTLRPLCHRPVFQPVVLLRPELRTLSGPQELAPLPTPRLDQPYPETWIPLSPTLDFVKVLMAVEDRGYRLIYGLFHKSMPESKYRITSISRIQNPFLWDKYRRKQSYMARKMSADQRLRNERHLFHGTTAASVDAICKHNLDPRLSGKHAAAYGQGSYFARRASYSHRYAPTGEGGLRCLFLAKVMVGKSALGDPSLRRPPPLEPSSPTSDLYDSCVDSLTDPQIYVVFDSDQCYPYFLVHYLEVDTTLRLD